MEETKDKQIETGVTAPAKTGVPVIDTTAIRGVVDKLKTLPRDALHALAAERHAAEIQRQNNALAKEISQTLLRSKHLDKRVSSRLEGGYLISFSGKDAEGKQVYIEEVIHGDLGSPLKFLDTDEKIDKLHKGGATKSIKMSRVEGGSVNDGLDKTFVELANEGKGNNQAWTVIRAEQGTEKWEKQQRSGHYGKLEPHGRTWTTIDVDVPVFTPRIKATSHADVKQLSRHIMAKI